MKLLHRTDKAALFEDANGKFWCPHSMYKRDGEKFNFPKYFKRKNLPKESGPVAIEGEDIDFTPIVKVIPVERDIFKEVLESQPKINEDIQRYRESGFDGTYADWCSKDIPF